MKEFRKRGVLTQNTLANLDRVERTSMQLLGMDVEEVVEETKPSRIQRNVQDKRDLKRRRDLQ